MKLPVLAAGFVGPPLSFPLPLIWSISVPGAVRAIALAREAESLLVRDARHNLSLFNPRGELQGRCTWKDLAAGCLSDDGSAIAAVVAERVCWLGQDLSVRWEKKIAARGIAAALDPFGQYLAVSDHQAELWLFDRTGKLLGRFNSPRAIQHLAFVPVLPLLMAAADFGWAGCLDLSTGKWTWSDRPVSQIGGLTVAAAGDPTILACFSEGLRGCGPDGGNRFSLHLPKPCGLAALNFAGDKGVAAGLGKENYGFNRKGDVLVTVALPQPPTALALSALGERLICGFADGTLMARKFEM
ncbi:MAG TPA: hypothetical protein VKS79_24090 [Gemmataceae bacterium]|nr:hypothetical protein [Gemmataceae bacterium]